MHPTISANNQQIGKHSKVQYLIIRIIIVWNLPSTKESYPTIDFTVEKSVGRNTNLGIEEGEHGCRVVVGSNIMS